MIAKKNTNKGKQITVRTAVQLRKLIPGYLESRRKDVASLTEALKKGDYETIETMGHRMRGSGGGFGFQTITNIGESLEKSAKNGDSEHISQYICDLQDYLERVVVIYE